MRTPRGNVFTESLPSNGHTRHNTINSTRINNVYFSQQDNLFSQTQLSKAISKQRKSTMNYVEQVVSHFFKKFSEAWSGDKQTIQDVRWPCWKLKILH
jgi:hypothetical protein